MIVQTAKLDGRGVRVGLEQEPGSSGLESAEATVRRLAGYRVTLDKVTGSKETRADTFSTQVNAHNVSAVAAPWLHNYLEELSYFPDSTYKDQVDATSGAFGMVAKTPRVAGGGAF